VPPSQKKSPKGTSTEKNYITPQGYQKLARELEFLRHTKRPEVVNALADAAAEGDRSENAEYIYRKKQLRQIDSRLRFLAKRLDAAVVVDAREQRQKDTVFFGATVTIEDDRGREHTWRIVGSDEIDSGAGLISWRSPVGRGLIGRKLGDTVVVATGDRESSERVERELTVLSISYPT